MSDQSGDPPTPEQLAHLDAVSASTCGYPYSVLDDPRIIGLITGGMVDRINAPLEPVA